MNPHALLKLSILLLVLGCARTPQEQNFYRLCPECRHGVPAEVALGNDYVEFQALVQELKLWIVDNSSVPLQYSLGTDRPIWFVPREQLQTGDLEVQGVEVAARHFVHGYLQMTLLSSDWNFSLSSKSELLHELVHELQVANDLVTGECKFMVELMAYSLQYQWLAEQNAADSYPFPHPLQVLSWYPC